LIYVPFLILSISFIFSYSFLHWLLVMQFQLPINEDLVHIWLAACLPWIPIYIWLRPRVKLLILKDKKGNLPYLYLFIAGFTIIITTVIAQNYLSTAAGQLTTLSHIGAINKSPLTKYYKLKYYFIDKQHSAAQRRSEVSGRNNEYLSFYIDVACPILDQSPQIEKDSSQALSIPGGKKALLVVNGKVLSNDTIINILKANDIKTISVLKGAAASALYGNQAPNGVILITTKTLQEIRSEYFAHRIPSAWLGVEFSKSVSNHESDSAKESDYKEFISSVENEFTQKDLGGFVYLDRIGNNSRHKGYLKAIEKDISNLKAPIIFESKNEAFEARNGKSLEWTFGSFGIGIAVWLLMILTPKLNNKEIEKFSDPGKKSEWDSFYTSLLKLRIDKNSNFKATAIIIGLNLLVFIIMAFAGLGFISFEASDLFAWGANYRPAVIDGQWWRLLTSIFLYGGLMHLLNNMYGLFFAAIFLEPVLRSLKYMLAYLFCGLAGSLASIWWHPATIGVGASGAIFGLYGILIVLLITNRVNQSGKKFLLINCLIFTGINLLIGLTGGIDNAAHIGGLISGLFLGIIFYFFTDPPKQKRKYTKRVKPEMTLNDESTESHKSAIGEV